MGPKVENIVPCLGGGGVRCWLEGGSSSSVSPLSSAANRLIGEVVCLLTVGSTPVLHSVSTVIVQLHRLIDVRHYSVD